MNDTADLQAALEAHRSGRIDAALQGYQRVLHEQPDNADALMYLGVLLCNQGGRQEGERLLRRSLQVQPDNADAWNHLGNILLLRPDLEGARAAFACATERAPQMALAWLNLGGCLWRMGQSDPAVAALQQATVLDPSFQVAFSLQAQILSQQGDYARARQVYSQWLAHHPTNPFARHMLAAASGVDVPLRASDEHIRYNFDRLAAEFDQHLRALGYCGPEVMAAALRARLGARCTLDVLDLGCGTGLCGPLLRGFARRLVGVDLSTKMIERARARASYDELITGEISEVMHARPGAFDLIVCVDTFNYFGALEPPLRAARACLRPGGLFAFTAERSEHERPFVLEPHGRYTHSEGYVRAALTDAGFPEINVETVPLRRERGTDCMFHVVVAGGPVG